MSCSEPRKTLNTNLERQLSGKHDDGTKMEFFFTPGPGCPEASGNASDFRFNTLGCFLWYLMTLTYSILICGMCYGILVI